MSKAERDYMGTRYDEFTTYNAEKPTLRPGLLTWWYGRIRHRGPDLWFAWANAKITTPEHVTHSFSAIFTPNVRTFVFTTKFERDTFCKNCNAVACENPYPLPDGADIPAVPIIAPEDTSESLDDAGQ